MPRGGIWRPPVSFRGGGVSVPTGHTGPAPVPVRGSIQVVRAPRSFPPITWLLSDWHSAGISHFPIQVDWGRSALTSLSHL